MEIANPQTGTGATSPRPTIHQIRQQRLTTLKPIITANSNHEGILNGLAPKSSSGDKAALGAAIASLQQLQLDPLDWFEYAALSVGSPERRIGLVQNLKTYAYDNFGTDLEGVQDVFRAIIYGDSDGRVKALAAEYSSDIGTTIGLDSGALTARQGGQVVVISRSSGETLAQTE